MIKKENFFNVIPNKQKEVIEELINGKEFWLERIISSGQSTPKGQWYNQETNEWVVLLKGSATLKFSDKEQVIEMKEGDFIFIPAHKKHRVELTDPDKTTIWLAIHFKD